jgi:hypothetical protein
MTTSEGDTVTTTTETALEAVLTAAGVDYRTAYSPGAICMARLMVAVWDAEDAERKMRTEAASVRDYAEEVDNSLANKYYLTAIDWLEHHAEKLVRAKREHDAALDVVRMHAVIMSALAATGDAEERRALTANIIHTATGYRH